MATTQTYTQTIDRLLTATREQILPGVKRLAFSHSPYASIFLGNLIDEMFQNRPMLSQAKRTVTGSPQVRIQHNVEANSTAEALAGPWDEYQTDPQDTIRESNANWKHYAAAMTFSLFDQLTNTGPEQISSMVTNETTNRMSSLVDLVAGHGYSGTASEAITGLDSLISANDTVQGLSGSTYSVWNSRGLSARGTAAGSVSFASGSFAAQGVSDLRTAWLNASEGAIQPNVILTTYDVFSFYEGTIVPQERYAGPATTGDLGFRSLAFKTTPVLPDAKATSGVVYFLNTDKQYVICLAGADFSAQPFKDALKQEARTSELVFKGQQVVEDRRFVNKITGVTA